MPEDKKKKQEFDFSDIVEQSSDTEQFDFSDIVEEPVKKKDQSLPSESGISSYSPVGASDSSVQPPFVKPQPINDGFSLPKVDSRLLNQKLNENIIKLGEEKKANEDLLSKYSNQQEEFQNVLNQIQDQYNNEASPEQKILLESRANEIVEQMNDLSPEISRLTSTVQKQNEAIAKVGRVSNATRKAVQTEKEFIQNVEKAMPKNTENIFVKSFWNATLPSLIGGTGALMEAAGDLSVEGQLLEIYNSPLPDDQKFKSIGDAVGEGMQRFAENIEAQIPDYAKKGMFSGDFNLESAANVAGSAMGSLASILLPVGVAGTVAKGSAGAVKATQYAAGLSLGMNEAYSAAKDAGLDDKNAAVLSLAVAIPTMMLDAAGADFLVNKIASPLIMKTTVQEAKKYLTGEVTDKAIFEAAKSGFKDAIQKVGTGVVREGITEAAQSGVASVGQEIYDVTQGGELFAEGDGAFKNTPKDAIFQALEEGLVGGLVGGGANLALSQNKSLYDKAIEIKNDPQEMENFASQLEAEAKAGNITPQQAQEVIDNVQAIAELDNKVPARITDPDTRLAAINIISERENLRRDVEGVEPKLVVVEGERMKELDEALSMISRGEELQKVNDYLYPEREEGTIVDGQYVEGPPVKKIEPTVVDGDYIPGEVKTQPQTTKTEENATKEGKIEQNREPEYQGITGQQQGEQENRPNQETIITEGETTPGSGNIVETSGEIKEEAVIPPVITEPSEKRLKLSDRILNSPEVSDDIKQGLLDKGVNYIPVSLKVTNQEAKAYVESFNEAGELDKAYNNVLDVTNEMTGLVRGTIGKEVFEVYSKKANEAVTPEERADYINKAVTVADFAARSFKAAGQEINAAKAWKALIQKTPEGAVMKIAQQYAEKNNPVIERDIKDIRDAKKAFDELIQQPDFRDIFEQEVGKEIEERAAKIMTPERKKKIVDFFDNLKVDTKGKLFDATYALPVTIWNGAVEVMKQTTLLGATAAKAAKAGLDYIKANYKGEWREKDFIAEMGVKTPKKDKTISPEEAKEKILSAWEKKLTRMTPAGRKKLLGKSISEIDRVGFISEERFKEFYAEAMGLPVMTDEIKARVFDLVTTINKSDQAAGVYKKAIEEGTQNEIKSSKEDYQKAVAEARKANDELSAYFREDKNVWDTMGVIMQGNLLTPLSLITNIYSNAILQPLRFLSRGVASIGDRALSQLAKHEKVTKIDRQRKVRILPYLKAIPKGFAQGFMQGAKETVTGLTSEDVQNRDLYNKIQPLKAWGRLISKGEWGALKQKGGRTKALNNIFNDFFEATGGIGAETFFRLLNLGDKPFRRIAELGELYAIADEKGLKGKELDSFLQFPDEESLERVTKTGDEATFQQENKVATLSTQVYDNIRKIPFLGGPLSLFYKAIFPFVKTPSNIIAESFDYVIPELSLMKMTYHATKGNRNESLQYFGKAMVGYMITGLAAQLVLDGLLTGSGDDDNQKEKNIQYENIPPNSLNISALRRSKTGGSSKIQDDDVWINYQKMGIPGMVFSAYANMGKDRSLEELKNMGYWQKLFDQLPTVLKSALDQSFLAGANGFLQAVSEGGRKADRLLLNLTNTISSIEYPNTLSTISRASDDYIRSTKDLDLWEEMKSNFANRMFRGSKLPAKISLWGEKVRNAPEGSNPYVYSMLDVTKRRKVDTDSMGYKIYDLWTKTKEDDALPAMPKNSVTIRKEKITLTPQQYEQYLIYVGSERKKLVNAYTSSPNWDEDDNDTKIKKLKKLYEKGANNGKRLLINNDEVLFEKKNK